jgi:hypothetical protein
MAHPPHPVTQLRSLIPLFVVLAIGLMTAAAPAVAAEDQITRAEKLLFVTDHLANLKSPAVLEYSFVREGSLTSEARDKATLEVTGDGESKSARVDFLPAIGAPEQPAIGGVQGNPIILNFLEHELAEMKRLTKGSTSYFRKRLRLALAENPQVSAVTAQYGDRAIPATRIRISPYADDPLRKRYEQYADKVLEFTLSDQVPGHVLCIHSELTKAAADDAAAQTLLSETLTFSRQVK